LHDIALICAFTALVGIDVRTVGGTMISRPIVVAPLMGILLGDLKTGLQIAVFIELVWVGILPVGAYLPIEVLPVTVISTYLSVDLVAQHNIGAGVIMFCVMVAVPFGFVCRWLEGHIRSMNVIFSKRIEDMIHSDWIPNVEGIQFFNVFMTFLKVFVVTFIPIFFGRELLYRIYRSFSEDIKQGMMISFYIVPLVGFGVVLEIFGSRKLTPLLYISFALSMALFYVLGFSPFTLFGLSVLAGVVLLVLSLGKKEADGKAR
jgi:N-acetylgalactosamine PTS system EIIC component